MFSQIYFGNKYSSQDGKLWHSLDKKSFQSFCLTLLDVSANSFIEAPIKVCFNAFHWQRWTQYCTLIKLCRSSRLEVFYRKGVLRLFAKFTGKHLCLNFFFNKVPGLRPATLTLAQVFSCEFCEISKISFFTEHLRFLLLVL